MRLADRNELKVEAFPVLLADVPEQKLPELLPIELEELDPFAEPEPSVGALLQLVSGWYVVVVYGKVTSTMKVLIPEGTDPARGIDAVLDEIPLPPSSIRWRYTRESVPSTDA